MLQTWLKKEIQWKRWSCLWSTALHHTHRYPIIPCVCYIFIYCSCWLVNIWEGRIWWRISLFFFWGSGIFTCDVAVREFVLFSWYSLEFQHLQTFSRRYFWETRLGWWGFLQSMVGFKNYAAWFGKWLRDFWTRNTQNKAWSRKLVSGNIATRFWFSLQHF